MIKICVIVELYIQHGVGEWVELHNAWSFKWGGVHVGRKGENIISRTSTCKVISLWESLWKSEGCAKVWHACKLAKFNMARETCALSATTIVQVNMERIFIQKGYDGASWALYIMLSLDNLCVVESYWRLLKLLN